MESFAPLDTFRSPISSPVRLEDTQHHKYRNGTPRPRSIAWDNCRSRAVRAVPFDPRPRYHNGRESL